MTLDFSSEEGNAKGPTGRSATAVWLIEFESYEPPPTCYNSPEYQTAAKLRQAFSDSEIVIVEGHMDG